MRDSLLNKAIADKARSCAEHFCMAGVISTLEHQHEWPKSPASLDV